MVFDFLTTLKIDFMRIEPIFSWSRFIKIMLVKPGFKSVCYIRLLQLCYEKKWIKIANQLRIRIVSKFSMDIVPGVRIAPGLRIEHPVGIVIGHSVTIGTNFTILQNSTLGERHIDSRSDGLGPTIGDEVTICANSQVLGNIKLSDRTVVLGGAILMRDTCEGEIIKGVVT